MKKTSSKSQQLIKLEANIKTPPLLLGKPVFVTNFRTAKRLLSRLILGFQKGEISGRDSKDLCYLVASFVQIAKDTEIEERLSKLEGKVGGTDGQSI
jgi:hypothetical protein